MRRDEAIARLKDTEDAIRALGATALYLYGSTARDEARPDSDVDVFIEYDPRTKFTILDLVGVQQELAERIGAEVDIATRDSLHRRLRKRIEQSAIRIF
jgi:predicted nucleotidyltransferase